MSFFTMLFLYIAGSLMFLVGAIGAIASFADPAVSLAQAFGVMLIAALVMGMGAIIQVLREIAANTRNRTSF